MIKTEPVTGSKTTRATPYSSQVQAGNVKILRGSWNDAYLNELENFPTEEGHDDQVDASADAFNVLAVGTRTDGILKYYEELAAEMRNN
jgi:predicted phage terminase large subunit-like protein